MSATLKCAIRIVASHRGKTNFYPTSFVFAFVIFTAATSISRAMPLKDVAATSIARAKPLKDVTIVYYETTDKSAGNAALMNPQSTTAAAKINPRSTTAAAKINPQSTTAVAKNNPRPELAAATTKVAITTAASETTSPIPTQETTTTTTTTFITEGEINMGMEILNDHNLVDKLMHFGYIDHNAMTHPEVAVEALKNFQEMANVNQTGRLDNDTIRMLNHPRCGDPDLDDPELINEMMGVEESLHDEDFYYRSKRYALYGTKWQTEEIFYCIVNFPAGSTAASQKVYEQEIAEAIKKWTIFIPLKITFQDCAKNPEIQIKFVKGMHGDRFVFDGAGGVLAHAFFPSKRPKNPHPLTGDVHLDIEEKWVNKGRGEGTCFPYVFTHELGHSLGLTHSKNKKSLMWPFYIPCYKEIGLQTDDINGIQAIYGKPLVQTVDEVAELHESAILFKSTRDAQRYCMGAEQQLCSKKDLQKVVASDPDLHHTEWFWIRDGIPTNAKVDEAECQLLMKDDSVNGCFYDKLIVTTEIKPKAKSLCCPLALGSSSKGGPEMNLCNGVFDAMIRIRGEQMFENDRLHTLIFKGDSVYAFDVFGITKGFPAKIKDVFPGFDEDYVCSVVAIPRGGQTLFLIYGKDNYYVFDVAKKFKLQQGYPKALSLWGLEGLNRCPRVVFLLDDVLHFVQNTSIWKYTGRVRRVYPDDLTKEKKRFLAGAVKLNGLASAEFNWASISSATSWKPGHIFFFNDMGYYHYYDSVASTNFVNGYPRNTAKNWFHFCS